VLEDCNMSCGLDWKEEIGDQIKAGKSKEEIIQSFIDRYGDACRITPIKRVKGKFYQYTRGFDVWDWTIFWGALAVWSGVVFVLLYVVVKKSLRKKSRVASKEACDKGEQG
ncbi:MAG: cytochrome c-type biogenesis protein CcmH, partial [Deltaproteobacteria bacterium]|nr:cytochrome c-type biogenesis protein CcmH [Deltaproteobacteria bacterium]